MWHEARPSSAVSCARADVNRIDLFGYRGNGMTCAHRKMKVGVVLPTAGDVLTGETHRTAELIAMARHAEDLGFDSVWLSDHFLLYFQGPEVAPIGNWECWTTAAAIGAATSRITIGTLVSSTSFRNPAVLTWMANTIDDITDGRLILGLGAGDAEREHQALGVPFENRVGRFEEAVNIIHALVHTGESSFNGSYYRTDACSLLPHGPRPGGPPILIGALAHSPRMLRLTAQYADMWNVTLAFDHSRPEKIPPLREAVDEACRKVGRDPATLERSAYVLVDLTNFGWYPDRLVPLTGSPEELAAAFRGFANEGISHLQVTTYPTTIDAIDELAEVLELLDRE